MELRSLRAFLGQAVGHKLSSAGLGMVQRIAKWLLAGGDSCAAAIASEAGQHQLGV